MRKPKKKRQKIIWKTILMFFTVYMTFLFEVGFYPCVKSSPIEEISPSSVQFATLYPKFTSAPTVSIHLGWSDEG